MSAAMRALSLARVLPAPPRAQPVGGGPHAALLAVHAAAFSSKRRTRYHENDGDARRAPARGGRGSNRNRGQSRSRNDRGHRADNKLFSALRLKQQSQLDKLRETLVREEREAAVATAVAMSSAGTTRVVSPPSKRDEHATRRSRHRSSAHVVKETGEEEATDEEARQRKRARDFERMMKHKAAQQERVKHLPLFREDSPLWTQHGERSLLDYEGLPSIAFDGPVTVIQSANDELEHTPYLMEQQIIGVDTESMPRFDRRERANPVCLIQIATLERSFLYRLDRGDALPPILRYMLEDASVIKVGHSLDDDVRLLKKSRLVSGVSTTLDTLPVAIKLGCLRPGLMTLCKLFLGGIISKEMQVSDWEAAELTEMQIRYAATDAWAPLRVMLEMSRLLETRSLIRVKSYNASRGSVIAGNTDKVLETLRVNLRDFDESQVPDSL